MADQDTKPVHPDIAAEPTTGFCGWKIFTPHKQTWLGFALAWVCVGVIIWLTAVFARLGS